MFTKILNNKKVGVGLDIALVLAAGGAGACVMHAIDSHHHAVKIAQINQQVRELKAHLEELPKRATAVEEKTYPHVSFVIDSGHGGPAGENVGTTIKYKLPERDYVLRVGQSLAAKMNEMGYTRTQTTRTEASTTLKLKDRLARFEQDKQNIGVSIHVDGVSSSSVHGVTVYYNESGKELAEYIANQLKPIFGKANTRKHTNYRVLKGKNPAVLVELGFGGSNKNDAKIAIEKEKEIVDALAVALHKYYSASK